MFDDRGHRPHADFKGQEPTTKISRGPEALRVWLAKWEPQQHIDYVYNALQANWGDAPSRIEDHNGALIDGATGVTLTDDERQSVYAYVAKCFAGGTLPQILEEFRFHFVIDGVCRACTHQLVRTRGADVMQHGGRDNDWRHRGWSMPETIARACDAERDEREENGRTHCITDWRPILRHLERTPAFNGFENDGAGNPTLRGTILHYLDEGKRLYSALVDAGIPWQDARRLLTMGSQTFLHIGYNYLDLMRTLSNRLEHVMDWEFNCVAQLMVREVRMQCPRYMWEPLVSASDKAQKAMFAGLTSWPPDGKWPVPDEVKDWPRAHRSEQMPFWVLSKESMDGGPIRWIPTNGVFPDEAR